MTVGIDLVEIARVRRALERYPSFRERCFTEAERAYCDSRPNPPQHYAARFAGKEAIEAAYRKQPPDDELHILQRRDSPGRVEARYAWLAEPDVAAGEMFLTHDDGMIQKLVITFDRGVTWD